MPVYRSQLGAYEPINERKIGARPRGEEAIVPAYRILPNLGVNAMALILILALGIACVGLALKLFIYWRTAPGFPAVLTPAPSTRVGVLGRVACEVLLFRSLWRADKLGWVLGMGFHYSLAFVILGHHWLFFDPPLTGLMGHNALSFAPELLGLSLLGLLLRRCFHPRLRFISSPSDYLWLVLLLTIVLSGSFMWTVAPLEAATVRAFTLGLVVGDWVEAPWHWPFLLHMSAISLLLCIFPFSKMLHAPAIFITPTRAGRDKARQ